MRARTVRTISEDELREIEALMGPANTGDVCIIREDATETTAYIELLYTEGHLSRLLMIPHDRIDQFLRFHICIKKFGTFDEGHYRYSGLHPIVPNF
jgi:hypothetical protein